MKNHTDENLLRRLFAYFVGQIASVLLTTGKSAALTFRRKKVTISLVAISLVVLSALSIAETTVLGDAVYSTTSADEMTPPKVRSLPFDGAKMLQAIFGSMDDKLRSVAGSTALMGFRDLFLIAGLSVMMLWTGVKTMMAGKGIGELLGEWIPLLMSAGVVVAFTDPGPNSVGNQIVATMNSIATAITGAVGGTKIDTSSIAKVVQTSVYTTLATVFDIFQTPQQSQMSFESGYIGTITVYLLRLMMSCAAAVLVVIAMCIYIATAIMAMASTTLVVAMAPVMVPFLVFKPMAWLFDSWIRFLLGACMMKLVGAFMLALTSGLFVQMRVLAKSVSADSQTTSLDSFTGDVILYSMVLMVALLSGLLMAQVPSISAGLMAGSAGGAGFSSLRGVTHTMGASAGHNVSEYSADKLYREKAAEKLGRDHAKKGINTGGREFSSVRAQVAYAKGRAKPPAN